MHMALLNAIDLRLRAAEIVVTGRAGSAALLMPPRLPPLDRIVLARRGRASAPASHPARQDRYAPTPRLSSASVKPARCRSAIRHSQAPSTQCDILDDASFGMISCLCVRGAQGDHYAKQDRLGSRRPDARLGERRARRPVVRLCQPQRRGGPMRLYDRIRL